MSEQDYIPDALCERCNHPGTYQVGRMLLCSNCREVHELKCRVDRLEVEMAKIKERSIDRSFYGSPIRGE